MTEPVSEVVPEALVDERVDRVVSMILSVSRSAAVSLIRSGRVSIGDRVVTRPAERLATGGRLRIEPAEETVDESPRSDPDVDVPVVYEDEFVIVVDKPAGLVVHPGPGHEGGTLVNGLLARFPELAMVGEPERPGIVHRLDRGTSGLLVVARTEESRRVLAEQLADRSMLRRYTTLVWNHPATSRGSIDAPIGRSPRRPTKMAVVTGGREARTHYEVTREYHDPVAVALLDCHLETGRTHQIRVHLSAIGHAVVGDDRYEGVRQSLPCPRPFLHARELAFVDPAGRRREFRSELPDDLRTVLDGLA